MSNNSSTNPPEYHDHETWAGNESDATNEFTVVPFNQLSQNALAGVIDEFIQREGTDYGLTEVDYQTKVEQVKAQIVSGEAVIAFDHDSQTVTILHKDQLL